MCKMFMLDAKYFCIFRQIFKANAISVCDYVHHMNLNKKILSRRQISPDRIFSFFNTL